MVRYDTMSHMLYLSNAIRLTHRGISTTHIYIKTKNRTKQITTLNSTNKKKTQIATYLEECGPCSIFASFTLAFVLQLREKYRKTSVILGEGC